MYSASILLQLLSPPTLARVALFVVKTHQRQVDWLLYDSAGTFLSALALPLSSFAPQLSNSRRRVCRGVPAPLETLQLFRKSQALES